MPWTDKTLIDAQSLNLRRNGLQLLHDVSLHVDRGEIVTLIGPNGAGKTTLVKLLLGLATADSGTIRRHPQLKVGYVPQRISIDPAVPLTVERFITLGLSATQQKVHSLLQETGAGQLFGKQMTHLSGGEFQRVLLSRALIADPDLLVLDEPAQGVDMRGEARLYGLIERLRSQRGCGILMVSHDLHIVFSGSDRVICLNRHVCCSGVPEQVAKHPQYQQIFGTEHASAFGLYRHEHDHSHDLTGRIISRSVSNGDSAAEKASTTARLADFQNRDHR